MPTRVASLHLEGGTLRADALPGPLRLTTLPSGLVTGRLSRIACLHQPSTSALRPAAGMLAGHSRRSWGRCSVR
eukprot:scaffold418_cov386-Prasinococcus_capsulatus_cf.AAC.9